jgi:hypothetical protein
MAATITVAASYTTSGDTIGGRRAFRLRGWFGVNIWLGNECRRTLGRTIG